MQYNHYAILRKEDFTSFISTLSKLHKLAAPVFKGYNNYAFEEVRYGKEIALKYILIGGTKLGKEVAPRIAQRSGVGCATDCIDCSIEAGLIEKNQNLFSETEKIAK